MTVLATSSSYLHSFTEVPVMTRVLHQEVAVAYNPARANRPNRESMTRLE